MATERTDKELTTPGRLACRERVASVDRIYSSVAVALMNTPWSVFLLTSPPSEFINNKRRHTPLSSPLSPTFTISSILSFYSCNAALIVVASWNKMVQKAICFVWATPSASDFLSHHWLVAGLATYFDQHVVSTGYLSQKRGPSKPMKRTQGRVYQYWQGNLWTSVGSFGHYQRASLSGLSIFSDCVASS